MKLFLKITVLVIAFGSFGQTILNANAQTARLVSYQKLNAESRLGELINLKNEYQLKGLVMPEAEALELVNTLEQIKVGIINEQVSASGGAGGI